MLFGLFYGIVLKNIILGLLNKSTNYNIFRFYCYIVVYCSEVRGLMEHLKGHRPENPGEVLTQEALESYLQSLVSKGCTKDTISNYRRSLERFFRWLPQGKELQANSAEQYQRYLFEECKYMPRTVNMQMTPVNGVLAHLGLWGYQAIQEHIQANAAVMIQMAYDRLLEQEQVTYGWMDMPSAENF